MRREETTSGETHVDNCDSFSFLMIAVNDTVFEDLGEVSWAVFKGLVR